MSKDKNTRQSGAAKIKTAAKKSSPKKAPAKPKATKPKATKPKATKPKATKPKATKPKSPRKQEAAPKAGVRLPWAEVVSRVIGQPDKAVAPATPQAAAPTPSQAEAKAPPTTIRFPAPAPRAPSPTDSFGPDEWVSVTYTGEEVFVHGKAGIFARGTTTHLRGKLARELANKPGFRVRRAA